MYARTFVRRAYFHFELGQDDWVFAFQTAGNPAPRIFSTGAEFFPHRL